MKNGAKLDLGMTVDAPEGALPEDAVLNIEPVDVSEYEDLIAAVAGDDAEVGLALDINFTVNEEEIEPVKDNPVIVYMTVPGLSERQDIRIVHISDDGIASEVKPVPAEELPRALGVDEIAFKSDEFSTYVLTWAVEGQEEPAKATIHWGTYDGDEFTELETPTTIDSTASSVDVKVIIDAAKYYYVGAEYKLTADAEESENLTSTVLKKVDGVWQISLETSGTVALADGSHIYVNYAEYGSGGYVPPSPPPQDVLPPETEKTVTRNSDGTYTVQLDITGHEDENITQVGANVVIVMDITQSMTTRMPGSTDTRMAAAKKASASSTVSRRIKQSSSRSSRAVG